MVAWYLKKKKKKKKFQSYGAMGTEGKWYRKVDPKESTGHGWGGECRILGSAHNSTAKKTTLQ